MATHFLKTVRNHSQFTVMLALALAACSPSKSKTPATSVASPPLLSNPDPGGGGGGGDNGGDPPPVSVSMEKKIFALEDRVEKYFTPKAIAGGLSLTAETKSKESDLSEPFKVDGYDSALLTGIYLGAQCHKLSQVTDATERAKTWKRISGLLGALETSAHVANLPGFVARYVYLKGSTDIIDPTVTDAGVAKGCAPGVPWLKGVGNFSQYVYCGHTSRDQIHGVFFGLASCLKHVNTGPTDPTRVRIAQLAREIALGLVNNKWKIPYPPEDEVSFNARDLSGNSIVEVAGTARFATQVLIDRAKRMGNSGLAASYVPDLNQFESQYDYEVKNAFKRMLFEQPWVNNIIEYYSFNLTSLALYSASILETDATRLSALQDYFWFNVWRHAYNHKNSQLTFMKSAVLGLKTYPRTPTGFIAINEEQSLKEARTALVELIVREPVHLAFTPDTTASNCVQNPEVKSWRDLLTEILATFTLSRETKNSLLGKVPTPKCSIANSIKNRDFEHYYWESNPFNVPTGNPDAKGTVHSPRVDAIAAYWLGRSAGVIRKGE